MNELHLFAGAGGGILAGQMLGHRCIGAVEWEPYAQAVLVARQNDGSLPPFPIWDDVRTFDGRPWAGAVDIVAGGFPCQDISVAGKGAGIEGARSGMWSHMARIVGEIRPQYVFVENSPALLTRGLGIVLGDLAALGYDCRWTVLGAANVGAPHQRDRLWILAANTMQQRSATGAQSETRRAFPDELRNGSQDECGRHELESWPGCKCNVLADSDDSGQPANSRSWEGGEPPEARDDAWRGRADVSDSASQRQPEQGNEQYASDSQAHQCWEAGDVEHGHGWDIEPDVGRVANGVAHRTHRLKAIGNGQVPQCAAAAFRMLLKSFD